MLAVCLSSQIYAQEESTSEIQEVEMEEGPAAEAPKAIQEAFAKKYPNSLEVFWVNNEENPSLWDAEFESEGQFISAQFDEKGNWKYSSFEIMDGQVPEKISTQISKEYPDVEISQARMISNDSGDSYEVMVFDSENSVDLLLLIDQKGKMTKKELGEMYEEE